MFDNATSDKETEVLDLSLLDDKPISQKYEKPDLTGKTVRIIDAHLEAGEDNSQANKETGEVRWFKPYTLVVTFETDEGMTVTEKYGGFKIFYESFGKEGKKIGSTLIAYLSNKKGTISAAAKIVLDYAAATNKSEYEVTGKEVVQNLNKFKAKLVLQRYSYKDAKTGDTIEASKNMISLLIPA